MGIADNYGYLLMLMEDRGDIQSIIKIAQTLDHLCGLVQGERENLADIIYSKKYFSSISSLFNGNIYLAIKLLCRVCLVDYTKRSISLDRQIDDVSFLHDIIGKWNLFDMVISFEKDDLLLVNPSSGASRGKLDRIEPATSVNVYLTGRKKSHPREKEALELIVGFFLEGVDTVCTDGREVLFSEYIVDKKPAPPPEETPMELWRAPPKKERGRLSISLKVLINKIDTFVHAGNADLIVECLSDYEGEAEMFVLRGGNKVPVMLNADDIWAKEIRNSEKVQFDFYGPKPSEGLLNKLYQSVNKYTQLDKT